MTSQETVEVQALYDGVRRLLDTEDEQGRVGNCTHGVYLFYDYDGEPIYVGQTKAANQGLRIRRHLHKVPAAPVAFAMSVLDPSQVSDIRPGEMWPFWCLVFAKKDEVTDKLGGAEYTVYQHGIAGFRVQNNPERSGDSTDRPDCASSVSAWRNSS